VLCWLLSLYVRSVLHSVRDELHARGGEQLQSGLSHRLQRVRHSDSLHCLPDWLILDSSSL
jgi:hypothetical protein